MRRIVFYLVIAATAAIAWGQSPAPSQQNEAPYAPAVPSPSVSAYGGYWGGDGGGASTVAGSSLRGMADVISAQGDYNLSTSAAAVNMTQAQKQYIQNRSAATTAYFQMQETNRQARQKMAGPKPTMEQLARIAQAGMPQPLSPGEVNQVTGQINWPSVLQTERYAAQRAELEGISATLARYGNLAYADQMKTRELILAMASQLKSQIKDIPANDYITSKNFLNKLLYASTGSTLG